MLSTDSSKKKFFEDRSGTALYKPLVYDESLQRYKENTLAAGSNVITPATQRLGTVNISLDNNAQKILEDVGVGGENIGSITVFTGSYNESAEEIIDFYRFGKDINNIKRFGRAASTLPMIRVSPDGFFSNEPAGIIDHSLNLNAYGQGYLFLDIDESISNQKLIPYEDYGELIGSELLGKSSIDRYPIVHNNKKNYSQFVDPSDEKINGAIDVFEVRRSLTNFSINDIEIKGIKGSLQGGGIEDVRKGSYLIESKKEYSLDYKTDYFEDSQELIFTEQDFPGKFALPGFISSDTYINTPFKDEKYRDNVNQYSFLSGDQKETLLANSDNDRSEIGTRFKSSTNGLIFGESNVLGTDSIAFGGLKK